MKKQFRILLFLLLVIVIGKTVSAQQANIWYFGDKAGLDFTLPGAPVPLTSGVMTTNEGCASICDNTGALLFYTDGISVWDATHTVVNSTWTLLGSSTSTQSAIIVPKPGAPTRYFIFTQDKQAAGWCAFGLNYTEVDVTAGVVTLVGTANINLLPCAQTTEKITAACHSNGTDYWAVTVQQNGDFVSWPITAAGIGAPVVSAGMASPDIGNDDRVGYMKISPQGNYLVLGRRQWNSINEAFTFNNTTGMITSNLGVYHTGTIYGVEFSSDGNYFYTTDFRNVVQYNIPAIGTSTLLFNSYVDIGALQLGPDGNIYVVEGYENSNGLHVDMISNINTYPATYNDDYITLPAGTHGRLGLPDVVPCFVPNPECELESKPDFVYNPQTCSYEFADMSSHGTTTDIVAWEWTFGDGTSSTLQNPVHHYTSPGTYTVCLTVWGYSGDKCCVSKNCIEVTIKEVCNMPCTVQSAIMAQPDACDPCTMHFDGVILYSNREIVAWMWDFGDGTTGTGPNPSHTYSGPGPWNVCLKVMARGLDNECCVFETCILIQTNCPKSDPNPPAYKTQPQQQGMAPGINDIGLKAYPNPASTNLHVEFDAPASQNIKLQLMDYSGKVVWEGTEKSAPQGKLVKNIDISNVSAGIYLLVIEGENLKLTEKIQVVKN